ncbi:hypothetical protein Moror_9722 [Moniliophthora roreri MCA 2997]|uniref:Uncharacterized protein n=1 Tax=Moniliophthora roreri (strain MCA 2997) TaxID=1381753 RepID=V2X1J5_MONRO|nr:hypothetical protein Moror_9722 [Moniliophthora roreri MCA 2997]
MTNTVLYVYLFVGTSAMKPLEGGPASCSSTFFPVAVFSLCALRPTLAPLESNGSLFM